MNEYEEKHAEFYLIVDLEATTSRDKSIAREDMETIEFGAVLLRSDTLEEVAEFQSFVRPVKNPQLTEFCTELTGITQDMVQDAPLYPEALQNFHRALIQGKDVSWGSWGSFDKYQIIQDCALHQVDNPMPPYMNLKHIFSIKNKLRPRYGMTRALHFCELEFIGTHHRALDDTKNTARMMPWILGRRPLPLKSKP